MQKVALITGASRGLGAVLAHFLSGTGHHVVLTGRDGQALSRLADDLPGPVTAVPGDVADPAHRARVSGAVSGLGRLDVLVNNASELGPSPLPGLVDQPLSSLERVLQVNFLAPIALTQELLSALTGAGGLVVNVSSDAARGGYEGWGGYGASKAALDLASLTLANELRPQGVAVVAVDPGDMRTQMHQAAFPGEDISDRPLPDVTLPFWAWLFSRDPLSVSGRRFEAQNDHWEAAA